MLRYSASARHPFAIPGSESSAALVRGAGAGSTPDPHELPGAVGLFPGGVAMPAAGLKPGTGASSSSTKSWRPGTGQSTNSVTLAAKELGCLFGDGGAGGRDSALSAASRGVDSRNSFFATPDLLSPGSPHAALAHMRPLSVLSPSRGETDDDEHQNREDQQNDTYALSPDDSARGLRQWRCWHTMHLPCVDKPEPVRMLAVASLGGAGGGGGGGYLLACGLGNGTVEIWDCLTWACISTTPLSGTPAALLWRVGGVPGWCLPSPCLFLPLTLRLVMCTCCASLVQLILKERMSWM